MYIVVIGIIMTLTFLVIWLYFVNWLVNSRLFHRLLQYVKEHNDDELIVVLYNERLNDFNDIKILNEIGFELSGSFANTNNNEIAEYVVFIILNKNENFVVKADNKSIGYYIAEKNMDDRDIENDWNYLEYNEYLGKTYKEIFTKIYISI